MTTKKKTEDSLPVAAPDQVPDYIRKASTGVGLAATKGYTAMPILKLVAGTAALQLQNEFGVGSIICNNELLAKFEETILIRPILFFPSWQKRHDKDDKGATHFIKEETMDRDSPVAAKARARVSEPYGGANSPYNYIYVDSYNFIVQILEGPMRGLLCVIKMSLGNAAEAKNFNSWLQRRDIDIYLNQVELRSTNKTDGKNTWRIFDMRPPKDVSESYTPETDVADAKENHESFSKLYSDGKINTEPEGEGEGPSEPKEDIPDNEGEGPSEPKEDIPDNEGPFSGKNVADTPPADTAAV